MGQERLEDPMILAVEAEQTQQLDLNHIRELFWNMADRRRLLCLCCRLSRNHECLRFGLQALVCAHSKLCDLICILLHTWEGI